MQQVNREDVLARVKRARIRGELVREDWVERIVADILAIVNYRKKYRPRGNTDEFRIPEDLSTRWAFEWYGQDAYAKPTMEDLAAQLYLLTKTVMEMDERLKRVEEWRKKTEKPPVIAHIEGYHAKLIREAQERDEKRQQEAKATASVACLMNENE